MRNQEARVLAERDTPTPEPYTPISSSEEIESELGAEFDMEMDMGQYGATSFNTVVLFLS